MATSVGSSSCGTGWRSRLRSGGVWLLLGAWFIATTLVSATLLARHLVPLPDAALPDSASPNVPSPGAPSLAAPSLAAPSPATLLAAARPQAEQNRWLLLHFLYAECKCSERVVHHLAERGRIPGVSEVVVWVGQEPALEAELGAAHFALERVRAEDLRVRYGVEAAPTLAIIDPDDRVLYRGGYTERKQSYEIEDVALFEQTRAGAGARPLPIFGCAVSQRLQRLLDPLHLL